MYLPIARSATLVRFALRVIYLYYNQSVPTQTNTMTIKKADRLQHGEKKRPMNNFVTRTAQTGLDGLAHEMQISRSELLEQIGRGIIKLLPSPDGFDAEQVSFLAQ